MCICNYIQQIVTDQHSPQSGYSKTDCSAQYVTRPGYEPQERLDTKTHCLTNSRKVILV